MLAPGEDEFTPALTRQYDYYDWNDMRVCGCLHTLVTTNADSKTLHNLENEHDNNGNIVGLVDALVNETSAFAYDALNRLTGLAISGSTTYSEAFTFDAAGRMATKKPNGGSPLTLTYDANHPHAVAGYGANSYNYDDNGNMVGRTVNGQTYELVYDEENRMTGVSGDATSSYVYDGDGNLVKSVDSSGTTIYIGGYFEAFIPTAAPTATATATATATETTMATSTSTPTATATDTPTPTTTASATPAFTETPTPTPTDTPIPPTPTDTPTLTPTDTPTPTPTATSSSAFPVNGVLDDFNRANGSLGSNWDGQTWAYSVSSQQMSVGNNGDIYWSASSFGANQEVYVTLSDINTYADEIDLLLKSQASSWTGGAVLEVYYDADNGLAQVWSYTTQQDWVQRGSDISVTFADGDRFGAVATSSGQVEVYKNTQLLATVDVTGWPYYSSGGYIGLWMINANGMKLDDFGGGTVPQGNAPSWNLAAALFTEAKTLLRVPLGWFGSLFGKVRAALVPVQVEAKSLVVEVPAGEVWKNYFLVRGQRVAMREYTATTSVVYFIIGDHLGSTTIVTDVAGTVVSKLRYSAYGEERYTSGTTPTNYRYTGQLSKVASVGLYHYGARWFDLNLVNRKELNFPMAAGSDHSGAYARFSPDNRYVAWMEGNGYPEEMSTGAPPFHSRLRVAAIDTQGDPPSGKMVYDFQDADFSQAAGYAADWVQPVGWLDKNNLLVQISKMADQKTMLLLLNVKDASISLFSEGSFVDFAYAP